jgi:hypothetical protein
MTSVIAISEASARFLPHEKTNRFVSVNMICYTFRGYQRMNMSALQSRDR